VRIIVTSPAVGTCRQNNHNATMSNCYKVVVANLDNLSAFQLIHWKRKFMVVKGKISEFFFVKKFWILQRPIRQLQRNEFQRRFSRKIPNTTLKYDLS
jgi:hypothetical protein